MREGWSESTLGDLTSGVEGSIKTGPFGTALKAAEYSSVGTPLISAGEVGVGSIRLHKKTPRVSPETVSRLSGYLLMENDIVFARKGAVDRSALVKASEDGYFLGSDGIRVRLQGSVSPRFVAYQFLSPTTRAWLRQHAGGTTMPSLNQGTLERVPLLVPPLSEQRAIAGVLGVLDDLIDTNLRTAEACGRQADASWKSAFFERDLALRVGDEAAVVLGGTPSRVRADYWGGGVPWLNSGKANEFRVIAPSEWITEAGLASSSTKMMPPGTTLIAITGATLGQITRSEIAACGNQSLVGVYADEQALNDFLFFAIRDQVDSMVASATGGAQQHINKGNVEELLVARPDPGVLAAWHRAAAPLLRATADLLREAEALRRTRDGLLPLLMSGAVSVGEVAS